MNTVNPKLKQHSLLLLPVVVALAAPVSLQAVSYHETVLADNPIAYYRLEDPAGSGTVADSSASGLYTGFITFDELGTWPKLNQPGVDSNSVSLHPTSVRSFASIPYTPDLNQPGPFTVEAWVRPTSSGTGEDWRSPVGNFGGWGDASGWFFYQSPSSPNGWIWVQKGGAIWLGGVAIKLNQWDHLAASFDGTTVTFYVNGVVQGSANASTALPNSGNPLCIGQRADAFAYFDGNVDEVAIYTNALTAAQIQLHYQVGLTNFYSGPIGAYINTDPVAATNYAGRPVTFSVSADGSSPLSYQWYKGSTAIPNATAYNYTFNCDYADNNAGYKVVVTNLYGAVTSAPATLTVMTDLILTSSPEPITRNVGSAAAFRVGTAGALPMTFKWFKGATPIPGATNDTLWLSNVKLADDASTYYVEVKNTWNTTNSETAVLTVMDRLVPVPLTGYAKVVAADGPMGYWRLDEPEGSTIAVDAVGSFDGTYDINGAGVYTPGIFTFGAPTGIPHETNVAVVVTNGARVVIPYALELNSYNAFAAEAWVKPTTLSVDTSDYRTVFSSQGSGVGGPIGWLLYQQPDHTFAWVLFADNWISSFMGISGTIVANNWYHIVLQYDGAQFYAYVNGVLAGSQVYPGFIPNRNGEINLGWRRDNDWKPFAGTIDEVAFYNKALTPQQIQAHYNATVRLSVTRSGNNVILSWPFGTLQQATLAGGTYTDMSGATSPYTNAVGASPQYFRVKLQ